ncbi:putative uncharacterized protein [Methanoculleus sp. CAG:1088]|nr:putative uncharacterized protein [Methanoculleus sp. CAG:1088]
MPPINANLEGLCQLKYAELFDNVLQDCEDVTLSFYGDVVGGSTPSKSMSSYYTDKGIAWLTPKDLSENKSKFISRGNIDITDSGFSNSSTKLMPKGTILYTSRAPIGYIAIAKNEITTNQGFKSIVPNKDCYRSFIYYYLKNNFDLINGLASGSTFMEISGSSMKTVPIPKIPLDAAIDFESFCKDIFDYQEQLESEIEQLTKVRNYLLPKLMSGEIDVSQLDLVD